MTPFKREFLAKLDAMGEAKVREQVAIGAFGERRRAWVALWLLTHDQRRLDEAEARNDASQAEQITIARSAADAAWEAARAAKNANTIATVALIAAIIAIAVSVITAFLSSD